MLAVTKMEKKVITALWKEMKDLNSRPKLEESYRFQGKSGQDYNAILTDPKTGT